MTEAIGHSTGCSNAQVGVVIYEYLLHSETRNQARELLTPRSTGHKNHVSLAIIKPVCLTLIVAPYKLDYPLTETNDPVIFKLTCKRYAATPGARFL